MPFHIDNFDMAFDIEQLWTGAKTNGGYRLGLYDYSCYSGCFECVLLNIRRWVWWIKTNEMAHHNQ